MKPTPNRNVRSLHVSAALSFALLLPLTAECATGSHTAGRVTCINGNAAEFACQRVDLLSHLSAGALGVGDNNDIWGWTDSTTGNEYVLIGGFNGTVFVDVSDPEQPRRLGSMRPHEGQSALRCKGSDTKHDDDEHDDGHCDAGGSSWRDIKVYADHAYVVSENSSHGMQVFDLTRLRDIVSGPNSFDEDAHYAAFGSAHNLAINESTGFAYAVGTNTYAGGLHFIDLRDPANPASAGGYPGDGYTHDVHCVTYAGPDTSHTGREICVASNEDTLTIVDVTNKSAPILLARKTYPGAQYVHQGWFDDSQRYFFQNDEGDESGSDDRTATNIWDLADIDAPVLVTTYRGLTVSIDHNNYTRGQLLYQSNYTSGLRILDISAPAAPLEVAYFDSFPDADNAAFDGSWSNYPYFASGTIAVSDMSEGLFLLRHQAAESALVATDLDVGIDGAMEIANAIAGRSTFQYSATVTNRGAVSAHDVTVTHPLQASMLLLEVSGAGTCTQRGFFVQCRIGTLDGGQSATTTLTIERATTTQTRFEANVSALNADPNTINNKNSGTLALQTANPTAAAPQGGGGGGGGACGTAGLAVLAALMAARRRRPSNSVGGFVAA